MLLEGDVGVGKTTLLRAVARSLGGAYERVEGSVDMMPTDLIYHTYISEDGKPKVDPGPLLMHVKSLSTFSLMKLIELDLKFISCYVRWQKKCNCFQQSTATLTSCNRNGIEEETFEISSAAKDRFSWKFL